MEMLKEKKSWLFLDEKENKEQVKWTQEVVKVL